MNINRNHNYNQNNTMKFSPQETNMILKDFPTNLKLSYENIVHKKVYDADIIMAIPDGTKYYAWFSTYKNQNVCFFFDITFNTLFIGQTSFEDTLSYGTIFYGTMFYYNKIKCFSIENILQYKGKYVNQLVYNEKLYIIKECLSKELSQKVIYDNYILFGLPVMQANNDFNTFLNTIETLPYKVSYIYYKHINNPYCFFKMNYYKPGSQYKSLHTNTNNKVTKAIFNVTPDIQNDIYNLHTYDNGSLVFFDIAFIPDYSTSVFMNKLFRKIKENHNLDSLEESDDEEEFQNDKIDKFVYLKRNYKMYCEYNHKFKKWIPLSVALKQEKIVSGKLL